MHGKAAFVLVLAVVVVVVVLNAQAGLLACLLACFAFFLLMMLAAFVFANYHVCVVLKGVAWLLSCVVVVVVVSLGVQGALGPIACCCN